MQAYQTVIGCCLLAALSAANAPAHTRARALEATTTEPVEAPLG